MQAACTVYYCKWNNNNLIVLFAGLHQLLHVEQTRRTRD